MRSLTSIALALAAASCASPPASPAPPAPDYATLHARVLDRLAVGDLDAALGLVENLPGTPPEGLDDPQASHDFERLRRLADLVQNARTRGITSMTLQVEACPIAPFESRPRS